MGSAPEVPQEPPDGSSPKAGVELVRSPAAGPAPHLAATSIGGGDSLGNVCWQPVLSQHVAFIPPSHRDPTVCAMSLLWGRGGTQLTATKTRGKNPHVFLILEGG